MVFPVLMLDNHQKLKPSELHLPNPCCTFLKTLEWTSSKLIQFERGDSSGQDI